MEPLFFKAENRAVGGGAGRTVTRFNGAAFFQSGKYSTFGKLGEFPIASMEPLFFKAENTMETLLAMDKRNVLQWSRFFSKRKIWLMAQPSNAPKPTLQWSRFFSKRKMRVAALSTGEKTMGFNGAAFFQSGK